MLELPKKYSGDAYTYKLALDGRDLKDSTFGKQVLNELALDYIDKHCSLVGVDLEDLNKQFVADQHHLVYDRLPKYLWNKYEVGYFKTSKENCFNEYILFNKEQLDFWTDDTVNMWGLEFLTIASRDLEGNINEIGFRIIDQSIVHNAIKWLFPVGQCATFGLHGIDRTKPVILCEGAFDYVAFTESNVSNVVGLGSVGLNDLQRDYLQGLEYTVCLDQDAFGLSQRKEHDKYCFFYPEGKDPFEAWSNEGYVQPLFVS